MEKCLVIHGHFYQPPRESAWTESIERQESAHPYHDWNERINAECYKPNGSSRILDNTNRIVNIVNNYAQISFNFGPTLLSWLEYHSPLTYRRILEADKLSQERCHGHGAAIAQAYNHAILPLCNERDKITQVRWGIADFRYRFGRDPETVWLPETAVNDATLRVLIDHGMKFVILSPYQTKRVRSFSIVSSAAGDDGNGKASDVMMGAVAGSPSQIGAAGSTSKTEGDHHDQIVNPQAKEIHVGEWIGVEHGEIDTTQAYRWFDKDANGRIIPERHIDVFFYHGALSRGVGFEHLLRDARNFAQRIDNSFNSADAKRAQLVSIATDGETYGHHERYADMALAYLLNVEAPRRHIRVTNYGEFLAENPPVMEVELKEGPNGEGTAWSCAHGVGRWCRNCGCRGDGPPEWTQEWRGPLRQALDNLRDALIELTNEKGADLLKDVWEARNDYIDVILSRLSFKQNEGKTEDSFAGFLEKHQRRELTDQERLLVIHLMEIQRQAQLMYTSCAWFFTEISGIETVQVIQYAARAVQLAEYISGRSYEARFLADLRKARSNVAEYKNGEGVYRRLVRPSIVSFARVVNTHAIRMLFANAPVKERIYHYTVERTDLIERRTAQTTTMIGKVQIQSGITTERLTYAFLLINQGAGEAVKCFVRPLKGPWGRDDGTPTGTAWNYEKACETLLTTFAASEDEILEKVPQIWGGEEFGLGDMLVEERQQMINLLLGDRLSGISLIYLQIYNQYRSLMNAIRGLGAPLPQELTVPARYTLSQRLRQDVEQLRNVTKPEAYKHCLEIVRTAKRLGLQLDTQQPSQLFQEMIEHRLQRLYDNFAAGSCKEIVNLVDIADRLKLALDEASIQNQIFSILQDRIGQFIDRILAAPPNQQDYDHLSSFLQIAYRFNFNIKPYKDRLKPVEQEWSQDPRYWP